jgi:hypothetical protein
MVMLGIMVAPSRVMPGMIPVVDAAMMREGVTSTPMVGGVSGRSRVSVACMSMMPVPAMAVRSMTGMSMPAMSALAEGRDSIAQQESNHHRQTKQTETSHHFEAPLLWPIPGNASLRSRSSRGRRQSFKPGFGRIERDFAVKISKNPIFFPGIESAPTF